MLRAELLAEVDLKCVDLDQEKRETKGLRSEAQPYPRPKLFASDASSLPSELPPSPSDVPSR